MVRHIVALAAIVCVVGLVQRADHVARSSGAAIAATLAVAGAALPLIALATED